MADYGATDTSTTVLAGNQFPVSAAWVPGDALRAVEGASKTTDGGGKMSVAVAVARKTMQVYVAAAGTVTSGTTQNSGDLAVGAYTELALDITTTAQAGTSPTIQFFYERKGADGVYYVLWQSAVLTAAANTISTSIGAGMAYNLSLGLTGRLRWVVGGSATPTYTYSVSLYGK